MSWQHVYAYWNQGSVLLHFETLVPFFGGGFHYHFVYIWLLHVAESSEVGSNIPPPSRLECSQVRYEKKSRIPWPGWSSLAGRVFGCFGHNINIGPWVLRRTIPSPPKSSIGGGWILRFHVQTKRFWCRHKISWWVVTGTWILLGRHSKYSISYMGRHSIILVFIP